MPLYPMVNEKIRSTIYQFFVAYKTKTRSLLIYDALSDRCVVRSWDNLDKMGKVINSNKKLMDDIYHLIANYDLAREVCCLILNGNKYKLIKVNMREIK